MRSIHCCAGLTVIAIAIAVAAAHGDATFELASVGVGSCNRHDRDQSYWGRLGDAVARRGKDKADGFVWLGDVVYNDHSPVIFVWRPDTLERMRGKMVTFRNSPHYANFAANRVAPGHVVGVWDDHDMGKNDGGREYELRAETQTLFLDFLDVPKESARRRRVGVYSAHGIPIDRKALAAAEPSLSAESKALLRGKEYSVCTILLDGRSGRDALGSNGDMLGPEQWEWLDRTIADPADELGPIASDAEDVDETAGAGSGTLFDRCLVTIIGSGVQVLSDEKPTEHWGHFAKSRQRLAALLHKHRAERFVFFSGDVHYAEIQRIAASDSPFGFPVYDVTTSGMTHAVGDFLPNWIFDAFCGTPRRVARFLQRNFARVAVAVDAKGGLLLNATVHSIRTGASEIGITVPVAQLQFGSGATPAEAPCREACDLPVTEALLKWMLFGFRRTFAPDMPVHRLLSGFVVTALLVVCVATGLCCRVYARRRGKAKVAPKKD